MTDKMTPQELNENIALKRGHTKIVFGHCEGAEGYSWQDPEKRITNYIPDFRGDWRYAGQLLEEMGKRDIRPSLFYCENFKWTCNISILEPEGRYFEAKVSVRNSDCPTRAIAEAWWKVFGDE